MVAAGAFDKLRNDPDLIGDTAHAALDDIIRFELASVAISRAVREQIRDRLPIAFVDASEHEVTSRRRLRKPRGMLCWCRVRRGRADIFCH
jgi:hypothetical protein